MRKRQYREIPLAGGKHVALVDADVYGAVMRFSRKWHIHRSGKGKVLYARSSTTRKVLLHQAILGARAGSVLPGLGLQIHHKNRNGLDCRSENLELVVPSQHARIKGPRTYRGALSSSCFVGVSLRRPLGSRYPCKASIYVGDRDHYLGSYVREVEAAAVRDQAALLAWGEGCFLNLSHEYREQLLEELGNRRPELMLRL
ncbi:hypothetical protein ES708_04734 [subsurface metagenome]